MSEHFSHTEFVTHSLTASAVDYAIPQPSEIAGLGQGNVTVSTDALDVAAPPGNLGNVFVELSGVATASSLVVRPGDKLRISGSDKATLSALAANAGDQLEVTALYR